MYNPIVIFAYNRAEHFKKLVESLKLNPEFEASKKILFIDGPKNQKDEKEQTQIHHYLKINPLTNLETVQRDRNLGLSSNLIAGIDQAFIDHEKIIILEDDLLVSPYFLRFMNEGLQLYEFDVNVASIHGYLYPMSFDNKKTFFMRGADCWGWGTWRRAWIKFEKSGEKLYKELNEKGLMREFNLDGAAPFKEMLKDQINGKNDSWAIRWHASMYIQEMYTLYPGTSLVENIGLDGSGVHSGVTKTMDTNVSRIPISVSEIEVKEDQAIRNEFKKFFKLQKLKYLREKFRKLFIEW